MSSGRGGFREGAGRRSGWINKETQTIRVPKIFAAQLLEIAKKLDEGEVIDFVSKSKNGIESVTKSKLKRADSVTESNDSCPYCGASDWGIEGYRTLQSGQRKQKRICKNCARMWSVSIG